MVWAARVNAGRRGSVVMTSILDLGEKVESVKSSFYLGHGVGFAILNQ